MPRSQQADSGDAYTDEETARRRDEVIRRMVNTPPREAQCISDYQRQGFERAP